jgi:hypothetical protein
LAINGYLLIAETTNSLKTRQVNQGDIKTGRLRNI